MRNSVLYITRNGMLEPLGQSQVLGYLRGLSRDYRITLVSFEKAEDLADSVAMQRVRDDCNEHGIAWRPQRFYRRPRLVAHVWSLSILIFICLREVRRGNASLIHARSYLPAAVAMLVGRITKTPFIFDMRALWPEELITAGRLRRDSLLHRGLVRMEQSCLRRAATVVSLTEVARAHLLQTYPRELMGQLIVVIPTCADLARFVPRKSSLNCPMIIGCIGTVLSGWFRIDWLAAFFEAIAERNADARFEIVTRDDEATVRSAIGGCTNLKNRLKVYSIAPHEVHLAVQRQTISILFYAGGAVSELGRSPTRLAEVLGCGIPVITNSGVGDVASLVTDNNVGVLVDDCEPASIRSALDSLDQLREDPTLAKRCRSVAEKVFSLEGGTASYRTIYDEILAK